MDTKQFMTRPETYTNYDPNSPAQTAQQKWDEREGQIIEQNRHLKSILKFAIVGLVALAGVTVYLSLTSKLVPYIVEVSKDEGVVRNIGTVGQSSDYKPNEQTYKWVIRSFIEDTRGITLDPIIFNQRHRNAFGYTTKDAAAKLQTMITSEKIMERFGKETVQITINSVLAMEGGYSYQVRWTEESYVVESGVRTVTPYSGIFTLQYIQTTDEEQLSLNPVGIYISDFSWTRDASGTTTSSNTNARRNQSKTS